MSSQQSSPGDVSAKAANGDSVRVSREHLRIRAPGGAVRLEVAVDEIAAVSRGGLEIVLTRREADPITIVGATLDDARRIEAALRDVLPPEPRSRWRRRG